MVRKSLTVVLKMLGDSQDGFARRMADEHAWTKTNHGIWRALHPPPKRLARGALRAPGTTLGATAVPLPFMGLVGDRRGVQKQSFLYYFITPRLLTLR